MNGDQLLWNELKARFLRELSAPEQAFFLKKARECVNGKGYPVSGDLFNYCWFLTLLERLRLVEPQGCEGMTRFLLVQSRKEMEDEVKVHERRLEAKKHPVGARKDVRFLEYLGS